MKGLKLLLLTFATLAITACSDDTTDEWHGDFGSIQVPDTRQLSQKIPAGQTAGNSEIFFSTNDAWNSAITDESRAEAPTWVRINPDHGDAAGDYDIRVETDPNTAEESRTAFIEITCGTNSILITITQPGTDGEDTNEPDEPNIGEQVRYWQLHKIVGRDASGSLIAEMEYTYELPAEFSKECRITGFKISAADKNGTLRPVETWQFTYEGDDCIRFSFTREIDGEQPYTQTADGTLYGYFCDVRSGGYELTSTLSGSEIETYGFDCTYGTGTFNSDKLTSISRYNSLTLEPICEKYEWEKIPGVRWRLGIIAVLSSERSRTSQIRKHSGKSTVTTTMKRRLGAISSTNWKALPSSTATRSCCWLPNRISCADWVSSAVSTTIFSERSRPVPTTRLRPRPSNTRVRQSHTMLKLRHRSSLPARPEATSGRASVDSRFNSAASTSKIRNSYFAASLCAPGNEKRGKVLAIPRFSLPMPGPVISLPSPG